MSEKTVCWSMEEFLAQVRAAVAEGLEAVVEAPDGREMPAAEFLRRWEADQARMRVN